MRRDDLTGQKIGRLTVISYVKSSINGHAIFKCLCECGKYTEVFSSNLKKGKHTQSCGCAKGFKKIGYDFSPAIWNCIYNSYVKGAKKRNLEFNINIELFKELTQKPCYYCGFTGRNIVTSYLRSYTSNKKDPRRSNMTINANGLDRKNNKEGYDINNIVPCCTDCNFLKGKFDMDVFLQLIYKINDFTLKPKQVKIINEHY